MFLGPLQVAWSRLTVWFKKQIYARVNRKNSFNMSRNLKNLLSLRLEPSITSLQLLTYKNTVIFNQNKINVYWCKSHVEATPINCRLHATSQWRHLWRVPKTNTKNTHLICVIEPSHRHNNFKRFFVFDYGGSVMVLMPKGIRVTGAVRSNVDMLFSIVHCTSFASCRA